MDLYVVLIVVAVAETPVDTRYIQSDHQQHSYHKPTLKQVHLHLNVKLFSVIRKASFVIYLFCIILFVK